MTHKNLEAWKSAISLVLDIYTVTKSFPKEEIYGLTNQMRRCAISIPSNIAEGCARKTSKETAQFLHIALGSVAELETLLIIAKELNYSKNIDDLLNKLVQTRKLILGLTKYHSTK